MTFPRRSQCHPLSLGRRRASVLLAFALLLGFAAMRTGNTATAADPPPGPASKAKSPVLSTAAPAASDAPKDVGLDSEGNLPTFYELWDTSPGINTSIFALSFVSLALFTYFVMTISPAVLCPTAFVDDVTKLVISGQYDQAAILCRNNRHILIASVVQRCVENPTKDHSLLVSMIDAEGRRRADILWNRISYMLDVSNIAPMLGLLGTVVGMIETFYLLPHQAGNISSGLIAKGIGGAMATTMFGLLVAIPTIVLYGFVRSRLTQSLAEAEQVAHSIADHLKRGDA